MFIVFGIKGSDDFLNCFVGELSESMSSAEAAMAMSLRYDGTDNIVLQEIIHSSCGVSLCERLDQLQPSIMLEAELKTDCPEQLIRKWELKLKNVSVD